MRTVYLIASVLGFVLPYIFFVQFLAEHGLNVRLFVEQVFSTPVASFLAMDLFVSSLVFWIFLFSEGRRLKIGRLWVYVFLNLLVGLSFALPVFLFVREGARGGTGAV